MRKMARLTQKDDRDLVKEINDLYQKLEKNGCRIISTQIVKDVYINFVAFIEYETTAMTK